MPDNVRAVALSTHAIRLTWSIRIPQSSSSSSFIPSSSSASITKQQSDRIGDIDPNVINVNNDGTNALASDIEIIDGFYIGYRALNNPTSQFQRTGTDLNNPNSNHHQSSSLTIGSVGETDIGSTSSSKPSYTYKTVSNNPIQQPLFSKTSSSSISSSSINSGRSKFLLEKQSYLLKSNQTIKSDGGQLNAGTKDDITMMMIPSSSSSSAMIEQYYEHIVDSLQRQTQYQ